MVKTELQSESPEGMKIINAQLREQMRQQGARMDTFQTTAEARISHIKTTDEYKHTSPESIIRNLPDSTTVRTVNK